MKCLLPQTTRISLINILISNIEVRMINRFCKVGQQPRNQGPGYRETDFQFQKFYLVRTSDILWLISKPITNQLKHIKVEYKWLHFSYLFASKTLKHNFWENVQKSYSNNFVFMNIFIVNPREGRPRSKMRKIDQEMDFVDWRFGCNFKGSRWKGHWKLECRRWLQQAFYET